MLTPYRKSSEAPQVRSRSSYLTPILFILVFGSFPSLLPPFRFSSAIIYILYFPIAEEMLKLYLYWRYGKGAFPIVVAFAFCEFLLVKVPLFLDLTSSLQFVAVLLASSAAFLFHINTAFAYLSFVVGRRLLYCFMGCIIIHMALNSLGFLLDGDMAVIGGSAVLALMPLFLTLTRTRWVSCPGFGTRDAADRKDP